MLEISHDTLADIISRNDENNMNKSTRNVISYTSIWTYLTLAEFPWQWRYK